MNHADIRTLYDYSVWATDRIFAQADKLTDAQFASAPPGALPSIRRILAHTLGAEGLWLARFQTGQSTINVREEHFPDVAALRQAWEAHRQAMSAYIATLDDATVQAPLRFERRGTQQEMTLWHVFFQLSNHGTQHRAEVAALLTDYGHSPGDLDFLFYALASR